MPKDRALELLKVSSNKIVSSNAEFMHSIIFSGETGIVNLSDVVLTDDQISILSKGLTFCPSPGEPDMGELRGDLDKFQLSLKRHVFFNRETAPLRASKSASQLSRSSQSSCTGTTQNNSLTLDKNLPLPLINPFGNIGPFEHREFKKPSNFEPKQNPHSLETFIDVNEWDLSKTIFEKNKPENVTPGERKGLRDLSQNKNIVIKKADKGSNIVIMNRADYIAEGNSQLTNEKFYRAIDENLTNSHNAEISKFLRRMSVNGEISEKTLDYLLESNPQTPEFYMLPKIYKGTSPPLGRPIISANGCPTEKISKFVDFFHKTSAHQYQIIPERYYPFHKYFAKCGSVEKR